MTETSAWNRLLSETEVFAFPSVLRGYYITKKTYFNASFETIGQLKIGK